MNSKTKMNIIIFQFINFFKWNNYHPNSH